MPRIQSSNESISPNKNLLHEGMLHECENVDSYNETQVTIDEYLKRVSCRR